MIPPEANGLEPAALAAKGFAAKGLAAAAPPAAGAGVATGAA